MKRLQFVILLCSHVLELSAFTPQTLLRFTGAKGQVDRAKQELKELCRPLNRGVSSSAETRVAIERLIDDISRKSKAQGTLFAERADLLSHTWHLLFTTEAELLALIKDPSTVVSQTLDVEKSSLINSVVFKNGIRFTVDSSLIGAGIRSDFVFRAASLALPFGLTIPLPPFGKGWFDNLYVDSSIRIVRDVRGDTSVYTR